MIDGHCHLDKNAGDCPGAMRNLYEAASSAGVKKIILLNLPELGFDNNKVIQNAVINHDGYFRVFPSINPMDKSAGDDLSKLKASGAAGLKLHPRLHGYQIDSDECLSLLSRAAELKMPVIADCFPDGRNLYLGNIPDAFTRIAEKLPGLRIAIGHAGGHKVLDALMVAKYYKNVYLDLSYTLLYYRDSSVLNDIAYAIKNIRGERVFWGSDYPDRPYEETVKLSMQEFNKMGLPDTYLKSVLKTNAERFLEEHD